VLLVLAKRLSLRMDTTKLDKIIETTAKFVRDLESQVNMGSQLEKMHKEPEGHPSYIR
jgi:proteasome assembly chaperone (PAC2) family protein